MCRLVPILMMAVLVPPVVSAAQAAALNDSGARILLVDPVQLTLRTFAFPGIQGTRGHTWGPDGALYVGLWGINGIGRLDVRTGTWTTIARDPTNTVLGAPYQPVWNAEAEGGPGLWVVDGNTLSTLGLTGRNVALVDVRTGRIRVDAVFTPFNDPQADAYAHPFAAGTFLGVGTTDTRVTVYRLQGSTASLAPGTFAFLQYPCEMDAFIHEDLNLYAWASNPNFTGFVRVDLRTGSTTTLGVLLRAAGSRDAAVWNEPWERPGRVAYLASDPFNLLYKLDLTTDPVTPVQLIRLLPFGVYWTAREREEAQLTSWRTGPTARVFHLNFGPSAAGAPYLLLPSLTGYAAAPLLLDGLELWWSPDGASMLALLGLLGYSPWGRLDTTGQAEVTVDLGARLGIQAWWIAAVVDGTVRDLSNIVLVSH